MAHGWKKKTFATEGDVFDTLLDLQGRNWMSRGQSTCFNELVPSIDRKPHNTLARKEKIKLERNGIDEFRATARFFASAGEGAALIDDFVALMVLQHYGVPTRLLDWSLSPYVALYFAVEDKDDKNGELWSFSRTDYEHEGKAQWRKDPTTTSDGSGDSEKFEAGLTAFNVTEPSEWIIAAFYPAGFPRQNAQRGAYTLMSRFGVDHAAALETLLGDHSRFNRYVIPSALKAGLRQKLRQEHGIWRGALFPDTAGAAETVKKNVFKTNGGV